MPDEGFLSKKLEERRERNAFRRLRLPDGKTDFCSNDYLGIATNGLIEKEGADRPDANGHAAPDAKLAALPHGSGGSRLLAGNYPLIEETERMLAGFHQAETALIFNSGYDANLGVLSSIPQRGDTVLYDALSHASIRDGIRLSLADSHSFRHNDLEDLEKKLQSLSATIFVVTESVFSMDGDFAPLEGIVRLCRQYGAQLIIDEAHATGVVGPRGAGLVQERGWEGECLARIHTFGKAVGCHGAVVLGSQRLKEYLINFSRPFIYTTALPASSIDAIRLAYRLFPQMEGERGHLQRLIMHFQQTPIRYRRLDSVTPIQIVIVPGNDNVKQLAEKIQSAGLDVRPILYPTVPKEGERLRIVLHSFNTIEEVDRLIKQLE